MRYTNSVNARAAARAGLSAKPQPLPRDRPRPVPGQPRRKPGRPVPHRPRRPPAPAQRPAPATTPKPPAPGKPLPVIQKPSFPWKAPFGGFAGAFGLGWAAGSWLGSQTWFDPETNPNQTPQSVGGKGWYCQINNTVNVCVAGFAPAGWRMYGVGNPRYWHSASWDPWGQLGRVPGYHPSGVGPTGTYWTILNNQAAGGGPGPGQVPGPGDLDYGIFLGGYLFGTNWRLDNVAGFDRPAGGATEAPTAQIRSTLQDGTVFYTDPVRIPGKFHASPLPATDQVPWQFGAYPHYTPIAPMPHATPQAPPLIRPHPEPWSPYMPDVGPRPEPNPQPNPWTPPGVDPVRPPVPEIPVPPDLPVITPELDWRPAPMVPGVSYDLNAGTRPLPRLRPRARPARKNVKESKVRMNSTLGFIWSTFSPITETVDLINVLYENLPWKFKVQQYKARGRQPNPIEKVKIIYENINDIDVPGALRDYLEEQIEDMIVSLGSGKVKKANQKDNRPIGYEAGGGLTGGGPFVSIS